MKGITKGIYLMTAILLIALALPFGTSFVSAQGESVGTPLSFVSAQEESGGILFGFYGGGITREPATETLVQLSIMHTCEVNDELILEKVEICGENGIPVKTFDVNETLESVADSYGQLKSLAGKFESTPDEEIGTEAATLAQEIIGKSFSTEYFTLDLNDLKQPLTLGDRVPIIAKATFIHNGEALVIERSLSAEYQPSLIGSPPEGQATGSLPELQDWKPGVQHVHTEHSGSDFSYWFPVPRIPPTVLGQAQAAKNKGLSWIIITDHHTMMDAEEWNLEKIECQAAENSTGIKVMLGLEVGSCDIVISTGHYLAYDIDSYVNPPNNCQDMINEVNNQGGFGFIAHPYGGPLDTLNWDDWNVTGYTGLEIMNGPTASADAIDKWTEILEDPSARIFAIGNSDAHFTGEVANAYTWCDIGDAVTHSSVYSALKNGHSVSTNGPLIAFGIGDKKIGDTVNITKTEMVLDIAWMSTTQFGAIQRIEVYTNNGLIKNITDISGITGSTSKTIDATPQTLYVRLRGIFSNGEAYTNPIWVCVNGVVGEVRDVNANPLTSVVVSLYKYGDDLYGSGVASPEYYIGVSQTGKYWLSGSKYGYLDMLTNNLPRAPRNPYHPDYINLTTPGLLAAGYILDFVGDYGLVPKACTMSYAMTSVNHWLFMPPGHPEWQLSNWKAMESVHSWQYPS